MILIIIGVLLLIFFIVLAVLSIRTWHPLHVAAATLTFIVSALLAVVSAMYAKTYSSWRQGYEDLSRQLEAVQQENRRLAFSDPLALEPQDSVDRLQSILSRMLIDRGRVWRGCVPQGPLNNGKVTVDLVPEGVDPSGFVAPAKDMIVYAFKDLALAENQRVPAVYLGEFRVTKVDDPNAAELTAAMPLDADQTQHINQINAQVTWTLYETMPVDHHRIFAEGDPVGPELDDRVEQKVFGEVDPEKVRAIFAAVLQANYPGPRGQQLAQSPQWQALVDAYIRDGSPAQESDPPDHRWVKVRFRRTYPPERQPGIQVDSPGADTAMEGSPFDAQGQAVATALRHGEDGTVRFLEDNIALLDLATAEQLIQQGYCERITDVFVRPLNGYGVAFRQIASRMVEVDEDIRWTKRNLQSLQETRRHVDDITRKRNQERAELEEDLNNTRQDLDAVTKLAQALEAQRQRLVEELRDLYQTNLFLAEQLAEIHRKVEEELRRREAALEASASNGS